MAPIDPVQALRTLRDALRTPEDIPDVETLAFHLSSTLQAIHLHHASVTPPDISLDVFKGISRYLSSIQHIIITVTVPTFVHILVENQRELLEAFFCLKKLPDQNTLPIRRAIALNTYLTLSTLLTSSKTPDQRTVLPISSREFVLNVLEKVVRAYSVDDHYWTIHAEISRQGSKHGVDELQWEDAVKAMVGLPGKLANCVGKWKGDGWAGDTPDLLIPRLASFCHWYKPTDGASAYFDHLIRRFEGLLYELSQTTPTRKLC
jgi:hypothetical protein